MRTFAAITLFLSGLLTANAQDAAPHWLENTLYGHGKINAVVAVVGIIILGIGLWLWTLDRKLKRMEEKLEKH